MGLPALAGHGAPPVKPAQQLSQSKLHETETWTEKTKSQVSRETEKMMIVVEIMFLQELFLHAQQHCHSALKSCCFLRPASDASGDRATGADRIFVHHSEPTHPYALGANRSLNTQFLKGKTIFFFHSWARKKKKNTDWEDPEFCCSRSRDVELEELKWDGEVWVSAPWVPLTAHGKITVFSFFFVSNSS